MTLTNTRRPYPCVGELCLDGVVDIIDCRSGRRASAKRQKYSDKPCPRFTTTGALRFACFLLLFPQTWFLIYLCPLVHFSNLFCMDG